MTEAEIKKNFAKNVYELRNDRKLNQIQLGEKLSYSSKAISKWEKGDVMPDITTLKLIADFFDITVDALIGSRNVVFRSHRKRNRALISIVSALLSFFVAAIVFLILSVLNFSWAWLSFIVAIPISAIVLLVFASVWYKRIHRMIATIYLVVGLCLTTILILGQTIEYQYWWIILILGAIFIVLTIIFFSIVSPKIKKQ